MKYIESIWCHYTQGIKLCEIEIISLSYVVKQPNELEIYMYTVI